MPARSVRTVTGPSVACYVLGRWWKNLKRIARTHVCGICGEVRFDERRPDVEAVMAMSESLAPRGPDADGLVVHEHVALAHRRLGIIDLSRRSRQPMVDPELGLSIVYNGAIYNYPELRAELEQRGYRFFSGGDTEVLLKAYHAFGESFVERLNGMFAFAIVERESGRVVLGRDRLGIKPLYYAAGPGRLRFASSLPALLKGGDVAERLDPVALHHYMTFHAVVPAPHTLLADVRKLPPAHLMVIERDGTTRQHRYWQARHERSPEDERRDFPEWKALTLAALRRSVERRLTADVPVGVLLSGGLDSSLVVGLLAEAGHTGIETFSIGFETVRDEAGDEFQYSDIVAGHFGTKHHKIFVDSSRALPSLSRCIRAMSEPMVSHDNIGFFLLSEEVKKHVKVVQSGQGADEIFAGYHWYPPMLSSTDPVADYARHFFDRSHEEMQATLAPEWLSEDHSRLWVEKHFAEPGAREPIDKALRIDTNVMLVDDPVKRVDNMTMAFGLEARVPFLDHELVELAARIPGRFKVEGGGKYVLKEAAREVIPPQVIDRPKGYFPVPALKHLAGETLEHVRDALGSPAFRALDLFEPQPLEHLLAAPNAELTPLRGNKLWQLGLLALWLERHVLGADAGGGRA
jgi:asparagine synthase (glutamine-hydrolysing)